MNKGNNMKLLTGEEQRQAADELYQEWARAVDNAFQLTEKKTNEKRILSGEELQKTTAQASSK